MWVDISKIQQSVKFLGLGLMSLLWGMWYSYLITWTKSYLIELTLQLHTFQPGQKDTLLSRQNFAYLPMRTKRYLLSKTKSCIPACKDKHIRATWLILLAESKDRILIYIVSTQIKITKWYRLCQKAKFQATFKSFWVINFELLWII